MFLGPDSAFVDNWGRGGWPGTGIQENPSPSEKWLPRPPEMNALARPYVTITDDTRTP